MKQQGKVSVVILAEFMFDVSSSTYLINDKGTRSAICREYTQSASYLGTHLLGNHSTMQLI